MARKYEYYEVDFFTGEIEKCYETSADALEITLANCDCVKTKEEALKLSKRMKRQNKLEVM